ncbi:LysR family transcriptional regulator [Sciscionella marina]|uniref:LysR family transcriptional regulator n=1 Tax=Sciscionella marina TaxID=508770 RepID=UPI000370C378|nr:LysR family transcriptional regulator [Sciscionella marina]
MAVPPIDITDLSVFTAAARLGSFAAAGADLRMSGPSVSTRLAALERRLGTTLFERGARGSVLTPEGERFAEYATRCLGLLDEAVAELNSERSQRLVLAAPASLASSVFPAALTVLAGKPVALHCRVAHSDEVLRRLRDGTAHAGFVLTGSAEEQLRSVRVSRPSMVAVCPPEHPLAHRKRLRFADLRETPVVVYRWGPEAESLATNFEHPQRPGNRPVHTIGLPLTAIQLAIDSGYIAVVPRFAVTKAQRAGELAVLALPLHQWKLEIRFAYSPTAASRPGVATLLEHLGEIGTALGNSPSGRSG